MSQPTPFTSDPRPQSRPGATAAVHRHRRPRRALRSAPRYSDQSTQSARPARPAGIGAGRALRSRQNVLVRHASDSNARKCRASKEPSTVAAVLTMPCSIAAELDRAAPGRLHREPEIGLDLPRTQEKVLAALDGLPLEISHGPGAQLGDRGAARRRRRSGRGTAPAGCQDRAAARRHGRAAGDRADRRPVRLPGRRSHARLRARPAHRHAGRARPGCCAARQAELAGQRDLHVPARRGGRRRGADHDRGGRAGRRRGAPGGGLRACTSPRACCRAAGGRAGRAR